MDDIIENKKENDRKKLLIVSDTVLLDQRRAQRAAEHAMIDYMAERLGIAAALVAHALQRGVSPPRSGPGTFSNTDCSAHKPRLAAKDVAELYIAKRSAATQPPPGLAEALATVKRISGGMHQAGYRAPVRPFGPPAIRVDPLLGGWQASPSLGWNLTVAKAMRAPRCIPTTNGYCLWQPRNLGRTAKYSWKICALHRVGPERAIFFGGNLADEVSPASALGMRAIYVRLGILDGHLTDPEYQPPSQPSLGMRRPDAVVTRIEDLPRLPCLQPAIDTIAENVAPPTADHSRPIVLYLKWI